MYELKCPKCGCEFYVNPPVLRQKRTRRPGCSRMQKVVDYPRTGLHGGPFRTKEERAKYIEATREIIRELNQTLRSE